MTDTPKGAGRYPHIFSPLKVGNQVLKNRILMGSMHTGLEDVPDAGDRLSAYFVERVRGGVGMIITGGISPHHTAGRGSKLSDPSEVPMHRQVTDAVHAADPDVKICMQILHSGPLAHTQKAQAVARQRQGGLGCFKARAVVRDRQAQLVRLHVQLDVHLAGMGVAAGIGQ